MQPTIRHHYTSANGAPNIEDVNHRSLSEKDNERDLGLTPSTPGVSAALRAPVEVRASYAFNGTFEIDDAAHAAAGRTSDFSGAGFGTRDLSWVCQSDIEAERIARSLKRIGLAPEIRDGSAIRSADKGGEA
jgi:hypothetical protein